MTLKVMALTLCFVLINVLGVNILGVYLISTVLHCHCYRPIIIVLLHF